MQIPRRGIDRRAADPENDLRILDFVPPKAERDGIVVRLQNLPSAASPIRINKNTSLQFALVVGPKEMFLDRTVFHELEQCDEDGEYIARLPFAPKTSEQKNGDAIETVVKMHLWHGEKHLGCWEAGRYNGADVL